MLPVSISIITAAIAYHQANLSHKKMKSVTFQIKDSVSIIHTNRQVQCSEVGDVFVGTQQALQGHELAPVQGPQQRADLVQQRAERTEHVRHLLCKNKQPFIIMQHYLNHSSWNINLYLGGALVSYATALRQVRFGSNNSLIFVPKFECLLCIIYMYSKKVYNNSFSQSIFIVQALFSLKLDSVLCRMSEIFILRRRLFAM